MDEQAIIKKMELAIEDTDLIEMVQHATHAALWFKENGLETRGETTSFDSIRLQFADVMLEPEVSPEWQINRMRERLRIELAKMRRMVEFSVKGHLLH
jgi:hypothetical protein